MNTDITVDILRKAAEDIRQEGVWCRGAWFRLGAGPDNEHVPADLLVDNTLTINQALQGQRCAEGAIALAAKQQGWGPAQYRLAVAAVQDQLLADTGQASKLNFWNDDANFDTDGTPQPLRDGHQVADLFTRTADRIQGLA